MRPTLIAVAAFVMTAGIAHAEDMPAAAAPATGAQAAPPPMNGPRNIYGRRGGREADRPPMPPSPAARFRVEKGDMKLDVRCAEEEPMRACADIVLQLLEKIR